MLSPEAKDLRPLLVNWLSTGADLLLRDRTRKALALAPSLAPRIPFVGALPLPPAPPVYLPGLGFKPIPAAVDLLCPALDQEESVYLQSLIELAAGVLGIPAAQLNAPDVSVLFNLITNPGKGALLAAEHLSPPGCSNSVWAFGIVVVVAAVRARGGTCTCRP